ncbi:hypothetical protein BO71DRAFT_398675 [Aspergillus ellipticus CBS 707.79]|uniref:Uncharacterized protein n=1 Tax=Aspergillus ellipticus CBS 707.79 TaxID=1448320 RepID=A0A319DBD2_9EURO|nr:hypothetical protein BO71DRAFT_398675 [Aspergillus ellipticus CBS 707.79]
MGPTAHPPESLALLPVQEAGQNTTPKTYIPTEQPVSDGEHTQYPSTSTMISSDSSKQKNSGSSLKTNQNGWWIEILSSVASALCLVAIIVVLAKIDGKLLSSSIVRISPNTTISILSTAAKALMITTISSCISQLKWLQLTRKEHGLKNLQPFDDASRGPAGSFMFFFTTKPPHFLAYIGCFITIVAIAFDPCAQEILKYVQKPTRTPGVHSSITRSQIYDNGNQGVSGVSSVIGSRDLPMRAAIMSGLYDLTQSAPFICPGSNCTYPVFDSIGISSQCADVTSQTNQNCTTGPSPYVDVCTYTTPSNFSLLALSTFDAHSGFQYTQVNTSVNTSESYVTGPELLSMAIIRFPYDESTEQPTEAWLKTRQVYECSFSVCAHTYSNWTVTNGTTNPGTISTEEVRWNGSTPILGYTASNSTSSTNNSTHTTFAMNIFDITIMSEIIGDIFDLSTNEDQSITTSQIFSAAIYASSDIPATMASIATSMSNRMLSGPNATTVHGDVYSTETFIEVKWPWVILPAALVVFAMVFLVTVMIMTWQVRFLAWKSSLVPFLGVKGEHEEGEWEEGDRVRIIESYLRR